MLVKWKVWSDYIDPNAKSDLNDDSNREQHEGWQTLRTYFTNAAKVMDGVEYLPVREVNLQIKRLMAMGSTFYRLDSILIIYKNFRAVCTTWRILSV